LLAAISAVPYARAQQSGGEHKPPRILTVVREFLKPGKDGTAHEKTEALFIDAFRRANVSSHYLGMVSLTGRPRALFFEGYDSIEQWRKGQKEFEKAGSAFDRANEADGALLESTDRTVWYFEEEGSFNTSVDLAHVRYFEIERFTLRQGHEADFMEGAKLVKAAYAKSFPDAHWAMYSAIYGMAQPTYVILTPLKSAAEIDHFFANYSKFAEAMGPDGMKRLTELSASGIESSETNLFAIEPKMSYMGDEILNADPEFWRPQAAAAKKAPAKAAEKPKANP